MGKKHNKQCVMALEKSGKLKEIYDLFCKKKLGTQSNQVLYDKKTLTDDDKKNLMLTHYVNFRQMDINNDKSYTRRDLEIMSGMDSKSDDQKTALIASLDQ